MRILALETSAPGGGVALLDGDDRRAVIAEKLGAGQRHGQELLPACRRVLDAAGFPPTALDTVAVSAGPGSYTGLRIGAMAAKAIAYAAGLRLVPVSSLAALALTIADNPDFPPDGARVMPIQTARRDEVYTGIFSLVRREDGAWSVTVEHPERACSPEEARDLASAPDEDARELWLTGSGPGLYGDLFERLPFRGLRRDLREVADAVCVGLLGLAALEAGATADPMVWQPVYLRRGSADPWRHDELIGPQPKSSLP